MCFDGSWNCRNCLHAEDLLHCMCYLSIVGMMDGGGPLGGGGKPGGGTVMGNPTGQEENISRNQTVRLNDDIKKDEDDDEHTGRWDEWRCSADIGWWGEEGRRWYVWRKWSWRKEGGDLGCARLRIRLFRDHLCYRRRGWDDDTLSTTSQSAFKPKASVVHLVTWILLPSRLCLRRPSTLLMVAVCPPITSIVPLDFLKKVRKF